MPVGRRSSVCTSACFRSSRRIVSPAPPSNSTLSGSTTAARPCCFRIVKMCCRKFSCLLLVVAQKSSRLMTSDSRCCSPASLTMVTLLFLPNGGLARTMSYSPCLPASASLVTTGSSVSESPPMPWRSRFIAHRRVTPSTSSMPKSEPVRSRFFCSRSRAGCFAMYVCAARRKPPVPQAGPLLLVDQVDDEAAQLGRILDLVLSFAEDDAEHALAFAERVEHVPVVRFEIVAVLGQQA